MGQPCVGRQWTGSQPCRALGRQQGIEEIGLQGDGNLGTRVKRQLLRLRHRRPPALVVGSDQPYFNRPDLLMALENLHSHDLGLSLIHI